AGGAPRLQTQFGYYEYQQRPLLTTFSISNFEGAFAAWSEIGLNYARLFPNTAGSLGAGLNLRFLTGYEAAWLRMDGGGSYEKVSENAARVRFPGLDFGFTTSNLNADQNDFKLQKNGAGIAFDVGVFQLVEGSEKVYDYKIGVSLLDVGFIHFNSNTSAFQISTDSATIIGGDVYNQYTQLSDLEEAARTLSQQTLQNPDAARSGNTKKLWLPAALSIQGEYAFSDQLFLNALLIQRIPMPGVGLSRENLLAFTPRFEHRWGAVSLPVSVYNWQGFRVGLAARLAFLTLGTDNLGSWFGRSDYTGTDFYVGLKIQFSGDTNGGFGGSGSSFRRRSGRSKVRCYQF
ncbi:MAG: hypothetical protein D6714_15700, partial [Bacteroidetes bacterium]